MLKSMTGFGRGEIMATGHRFVVEIKAVNHRYNEIVIRMPKQLNSMEEKIRRMVAKTLSRGRIDIYVTLEDYAEKKRQITVDQELALAYQAALQTLNIVLARSLDENMQRIVSYPDVLRTTEIAEDVELLWPTLEQATDEALKKLMEMRITEGNTLLQDLNMRADKLITLVEQVEQRAPAIVAEYHNKLLQRMRDVLAILETEPDETRLLQEAALFADRTNFTEEITRFKSHVAQFKTALTANDAVGRKLDFIVQEINREINTIGSKANDLTVTNIVVDMKSEAEKIREQIQNIE